MHITGGSTNREVRVQILDFFFLIFISFFKVTGQRLSALRISQSFLQDMNRPRFRKRDKMIFYGRRMIRKVKTLSRYVISFLKHLLYII